MSTPKKGACIIFALAALASVPGVKAQTFTTLYNFTQLVLGAESGLILSSNTLYGAAASGTKAGGGAIFEINIDGTGFTNLYSFSPSTGTFPELSTNSDGSLPHGALVLSGQTLFGTAMKSGSLGFGTVFAVNTDGTGFTNLHNFALGDGSQPNGVFLVSNTLYGTARTGGSSGVGTVFAVNTDGSGFTNLHRFSGGTGTFSDLTNTDGAIPSAGLSLSGNTLFGVGASGGDAGHGTLFSITMLPPQLGISQSTSNIILTWAPHAPGVALQCSTNLAADSSWIAVSPGPVLVDGLNTVTNAISGPQLFYRLTQ